MHLITLDTIRKAFPETTVFEGASLAISSGERIGLIGENGSGKSTLLGILEGTIEPDGGTVLRTSGVTVASLPQDPTWPDGTTVSEAVGENRQAIALADRLGLVDPQRTTESLSGGQRKRLALAIALGADCDLLVLDEPTNHLDVETIDWLEDHLATIRQALILVTHDRYLLDRVVDTIAEVYDGRIWSHPGTYADYLEARAAREDIQAAETKRRKQRITTELAWLRRNPKARTSKPRHRTEAAREVVNEGLPAPRPELIFNLPSRRIGSKVVNLHGVSKSFGGETVLSGIDLLLAPDSRIGVVGPNGAGKTTLLGLMAKRIEPTTGKVVIGSTIVTGWYAQDPTPIPPSTRLIDAVREHGEEVQLTDRKMATAAKLLEMFRFTRRQQQSTVGDLSGGERRRLELLMVLMGSPNLLMLDEPTNDLDLDTLHALEEYLDTWEGALVVASHDRYFLDRVCRDIFSVADDTIQHHPGGWSDYWAARQVTAPRTKTQPKPQTARSKPPRTTLTYRDRRELLNLTERIPELEQTRSVLEAELGEATGDVTRVTDIADRLGNVIEELEQAETRWLELTELEERLSDGSER
jgi:ATP-binding cassette subfamily F protein uup